MSAPEYMLYHQNILAQVKAGSRAFAASHTFSPATRAADWRQNQISDRSRKYQPLPTIPCPLGRRPVRKVACAAQVTAGVIVRSGRAVPLDASRFRFGVWGPNIRGVSPTTLMTIVGCIGR